MSDRAAKPFSDFPDPHEIQQKLCSRRREVALLQKQLKLSIQADDERRAIDEEAAKR